MLLLLLLLMMMMMMMMICKGMNYENTEGLDLSS
jgi:hypothetical protein